ncbi:MAG TPA: phosphate-starvation-inducible PsiE family protein [Chloroflexia bacterium]|nr:phosphate-starvation-inducible PsiE family protein [Chloroflexia bacterium]
MTESNTDNNDKSLIASDGQIETARLVAESPAPRTASSRFDQIVSRWLDRTDSIVYAVVGLCFVIGAVFALVYSLWDFWLSLSKIPEQDQPGYVANTIIKLISNLLLVLIIMEVLSTVTEYLKTHANSVTPFLFIGIISATRGILSIGARLSVEKVTLPSPEFTSDMIELGVNAAAILALGITLTLLARSKK